MLNNTIEEISGKGFSGKKVKLSNLSVVWTIIC